MLHYHPKTSLYDGARCDMLNPGLARGRSGVKVQCKSIDHFKIDSETCTFLYDGEAGFY